jgi:hypothetical protein
LKNALRYALGAMPVFMRPMGTSFIISITFPAVWKLAVDGVIPHLDLPIGKR